MESILSKDQCVCVEGNTKVGLADSIRYVSTASHWGHKRES